MPLQRRLPKVGFTSRKARSLAEVRLSELQGIEADTITLDVLKDADILPGYIERVKVILSGKIEKAVTLSGLGVTKGAKTAIEAAGGKVED